MELIAKGKFYNDISVYTNRHLLQAVYDVMHNVENAKSIAGINNLKKLRKFKNLYRIKVSEAYRIGLQVNKNTICFGRFGHRSTFYKYFS